MPIINMVYKKKKWKREPWANTLAYFPLTDNENDVLGNYTLPISWTKQDIGYRYISNGYNTRITVSNTQRFVSFWTKINWYTANWAQTLYATNWWPYYIYYDNYSWNKNFKISANNRWYTIANASTEQWIWYHFAYWWNWTTAFCYLNGELVWSKDVSCDIWTNPLFLVRIDLVYSDLIFESAVRTAEQVAEYYNGTKWKYWL